VNLADRPRLRLITLCLLYVAQGIPWGFMATTLPAYLTKQGIDPAFVGATLSFTTLPYSFKWVWGPIIDAFGLRRFGRYRPWIVFAQAMMALTVLVLVALDLSTQLKLLAWMILIHTVFNALQDVAVDALAVDQLADDERGRANGLMYASKYAGGALGGVGMASLIAVTSLPTALLAQTAVLVAIMFVPLLVRERATAAPPRLRLGDVVRDLGIAFSLRSSIAAALLMLGANLATGVMIATGVQLFVGKLGWSYVAYTSITGGWGLAVGCTCAAITGYLTDRFGRRRIAAIASLALAAGWVGFALAESYWTSRTLIYALGFYEGACQAILAVALISLCMDLSWPRIAGSQFAAYMALSNFSTTLGYQLAARANEAFEFHGVYLAAGITQVAVTLLLLPIDPTETRRKLPATADASVPPARLLGPRPWRGIAAMLLLLAFLFAMTIYVTLLRLG